MTIKEIELFNFRIYKGENIIELTTEGDKNICNKWQKWFW